MALVVYTGPPQNLATFDEQFNPASKLKRPKFVGLSNQGATCYLNSLLQTLYMTPEFRHAIFSWKYDKEKYGEEKFCIPLQLQRLFGQLSLSSFQYVDTKGLTKSFGWEGSEVFQQQDVQELTRVLFDALEETFKDTKLASIIDELYGGELIDYIQCIDIDYSNERVDKFLDLSFAIIPHHEPINSITTTTSNTNSNTITSATPPPPSPVIKSISTLNECIEMFLTPELLDGSNQYYSDTHHKKVDAIKGLKFGSLPHIMSCNLKRFVYDFSNGYVTQKKLNNKISFPLVLDMNKYISRRKKRKSHTLYETINTTAATTNGDIENNSNQNRNKIYELPMDVHDASVGMNGIGEYDEEDLKSINSSGSSSSSSSSSISSTSTSTSTSSNKKQILNNRNIKNNIIYDTVKRNNHDILSLNGNINTKESIQEKYDSTLRGNEECDDNSSSRSNSSSRHDYEINSEFELFLKQQMNRLKPTNTVDTSSSTTVNILTTNVTTEQASDSNGHHTGGNNPTTTTMAVTMDDEGGETDIDIKDEEGDMLSIPDLLDYDGNKAPDQLLEERQDQLYHKTEWSKEDLITLIQERGEWIYELFAVLIHSGAINGGHYYAYIKELESNQWYNFNDSHVTPISVNEVYTAWGGSTTTTTAAAAATSSSSSSSSSSVLRYQPTSYMNTSNAYMLMYRKVTYASLTSSSTLPSIPFHMSSIESIPSYIIEDVKKVEEEYQEQLRKEEELRNQLHLRIYYQGKEHVVLISRNATYQELLQHIWTTWSTNHIIKEDFMSIIMSSSSATSSSSSSSITAATGTIDTATISDQTSLHSSDMQVNIELQSQLQPQVQAQIPFHHMRIRFYYPHNHMSTDAFDFNVYKDKTLLALEFTSYRYYTLETRQQNEEFELYYNDGYNITIDQYDEVKNTLKVQKSYRVGSHSTTAELYEMVSKYTNSSIQSFYLIYCDNIKQYEIKPTILPYNSMKTLKDDYRIQTYSKVIYEPIIDQETVRISTSITTTVDPSSVTHIDISHNSITKRDEVVAVAEAEDNDEMKWYSYQGVQAYIRQRCQFMIRYNPYPSRATTAEIMADYRWTISYLRHIVADKCHMRVEDIRLVKHSFDGIELLDDTLLLANCALYHTIIICVLSKKTLPTGHYHIVLKCLTTPYQQYGIIPIVKSYNGEESFQVIEEMNTFDSTAAATIENDVNLADHYKNGFFSSSIHKNKFTERVYDDMVVDDAVPVDINGFNSGNINDMKEDVNMKIPIAEVILADDDLMKEGCSHGEHNTAIYMYTTVEAEDMTIIEASDVEDTINNDIASLSTTKQLKSSNIEENGNYHTVPSVPSSSSTRAANIVMPITKNDRTSIIGSSSDIWEHIDDAHRQDQINNATKSKSQSQNQQYLHSNTSDDSQSLLIQDDGIHTSSNDTALIKDSSIYSSHAVNSVNGGETNVGKDDSSKYLTPERHRNNDNKYVYNTATKSISLFPFSVPTTHSSTGNSSSTAGSSSSKIDTTTDNPTTTATTTTTTTRLAFTVPSIWFENIDECSALVVSSQTIVKEIKEFIIQQLIASHHIPPHYTYEHIRLRDMEYFRLHKVLLDSFTLGEHQVLLHDNKTLCYQILDMPDYFSTSLSSSSSSSSSSSLSIHGLPSQIDMGKLILTQRWYKSSGTLSSIQEVYIENGVTIDQLANQLAKIWKIPLQHLRCLYLQYGSQMDTIDLYKEYPRKFCDGWYDPNTLSNKNLGNTNSTSFYPKNNIQNINVCQSMQYGDMLLVQDSSELIPETIQLNSELSLSTSTETSATTATSAASSSSSNYSRMHETTTSTPGYYYDPADMSQNSTADSTTTSNINPKLNATMSRPYLFDINKHAQQVKKDNWITPYINSMDTPTTLSAAAAAPMKSTSSVSSNTYSGIRIKVHNKPSTLSRSSTTTSSSADKLSEIDISMSIPDQKLEERIEGEGGGEDNEIRPLEGFCGS